MSRDTDPHELKPESLLPPADEPTRKTGATLKDIALAVDQIRVQFRDLARDVPQLAERLDVLHKLVMENADGWVSVNTQLRQHEVRIRRLEVCMPGECQHP